MKSRPSHVKELTKRMEHAFRGFVDASKWGVGGVWFPGTKPLAPFVWFEAWEDDIKANFVSPENPNDTITISHLELMGIFMYNLSKLLAHA